MPLIPCLNCGRKISNRATKCVGCGNPTLTPLFQLSEPQTTLHSWLAWLGRLFVWAVTICCLTFFRAHNEEQHAREAAVRAFFSREQRKNEEEKNETIVLPNERSPQSVPLHSIPWPKEIGPSPPWPKIRARPSTPVIPKRSVTSKIRPGRPSGS
jgi:hypothetical protein